MSEYDILSDEQMVEKVRSEDQELYVVLIQRYQEKLLRYVRNLIGDDNKAADIVQDTFIKAFKNLKGFDIKKKFSSWIYRIAHNETINLVKRYHRETPIPENFDIGSDESISDNYSRAETATMVHKCLSQLPIIYSEPLTLFYIDDKTYEEISEILRIPVGTVSIRLNRAKLLIKKICQKK